MSTFMPNFDRPQFSLVQSLRDKAQAWAKKVVALHDMKVPPELEGEKRALLKFAEKIKQSIEAVAGTVPELAPIAQMNLGAIPVVVGIVGVSAAAAAIAKWTLDYKKLVFKSNDRNALIAAGVTPQAAAEIANAAEPKGIASMFSDTKKIVGVGAVGIGLFLLAKHLRYI